MGRIYVAIDLETTGLAADRDAILEIGAVRFRIPDHADDDPIIERWSTLVNPGRPVPYRISRLTGIEPDEVRGAPRLATVLDELRGFVGNYPVVGHNVAFELAFLQRHGLLVGQANLDTFELASILLPDAPRYSLGELARYLDIEFDDWHRALADAEMTTHLFLALWDRTRALPRETLDQIVALAIESRWSLRSFFAAAHRAPPLDPASLPPPRRRSRPPVPETVLSPRNPPEPLPVAELLSQLEEGGAVAVAREGYEARREQRAMLEAVARALATPTHLLVEAGTGSGKSLAYLLAAVYQSTCRDEPVVVSTNTKNLQDQLYYDELPMLAAVLDRRFTAMRLKGRANYLCPRRLAALIDRGGLTTREMRLVARVLVWQKTTESGDRAELNIQRDEEPIWEEIAADGASCRDGRCDPHGTCFWQQARALAEGAHLLIVNHALLIADLNGNGLLPRYHDLIVDEAHHLEARATEQLGYRLEIGRIFSALGRLWREERGRDAGLLAELRDRARRADHPRADEIARLAGTLTRMVERALERADELRECLVEVVREQAPHAHRQRILPEWRERGEWEGLSRYLAAFRDALAPLLEDLDRLVARMEEARLDDPTRERVDDARRVSQRLATYGEELQRILIEPELNDIAWVRIHENRANGGPAVALTLHRSPHSVAPQLRETLFDRKRSVILTSATLSSEGSFGFLRERLGIAHAEELSVGSPFDYRAQTLVYLANDLPEPNQPNYAANQHRALVELARATGGRMLALFTSKSQLNAAYRAISTPLAADEIVVLGQYMDGSRTQLIERFRTIDRAVLLGTQSFWEGIDVPGSALSCLAITRLPFPVPTDPIQEARAQSYSNPFQEYSLPQTVLRFRQGFGRLIRATEDRGVVALLDSRLHTRSYGEIFLNSLPPADLRVGPFRDLPPLATRWLDANDGGGGLGT